MSKQLREEFEAIVGVDSFHRIDATHPLNLYIGRDQDARFSLLLVSTIEPPTIFSSQAIAADVGHRADGRWALSLSLLDPDAIDLFCYFCEDIINLSRNIPNESQGMTLVCNRYEKWQEMFRKNCSELLSESEVKGLIGELLFLRKHLFLEYEIDEALNSWIGPKRADHDFVCADKWYEVKATTSKNEDVSISSIEQLDSPAPGELVIVYLNKTSPTNPKGITLNELVSHTDEKLTTFDQHKNFHDLLLEMAYVPRKEYDQYKYAFDSLSRYSVDASFPALRRKNIPNSVVNAKYRLSISSIAEFLKE